MSFGSPLRHTERQSLGERRESAIVRREAERERGGTVETK